MPIASCVKVTTEGTGFTSGTSSAAVAIPNDSNGVRARKVMITTQGLTYIMPGDSTATATNESIITGIGHPLVLDVQGLTHIAHLQLTAGQRGTITPVE